MYVIIAPIQIKEGSKEQVLEALVPNARGAVESEPGCLRFDVVQDAGDPNRLWVYEIYVDEDAFNHHIQTDHYKKAIEVIGPNRVEGDREGAARGSVNVWPPDPEWK